MNKALLLITLATTLSLLTGCNKSGQTDYDSTEYEAACKAASQSPMIENTLFAGFKFGMTENQVDSLIQELGNQGKLAKWSDVDQHMRKGEYGWRTIQIEPYSTHDSYDIEKGDTAFYINFYPTYLDGKLVDLFCSAKCPNKRLTGYAITQALIEMFCQSNSEKKFLRFDFPDSTTVFIKDNLAISFFPQPKKGLDYEEGSMQFVNMPQLVALSQEEERIRQKNNPFNLDKK